MIERTSKVILWHIILFLGLFSVDLTSKYLAIYTLSKNSMKIGPLLNLQVTFNDGVTWSLFSGFGYGGFVGLLILITLILIVFSLYLFYELKRRGSAIPEVLVLAGGVANLVDRVWHGGVVDFVDLHLGTWHWASFNVADVCIVLGVALIAKRMLYEDL